MTGYKLIGTPEVKIAERFLPLPIGKYLVYHVSADFVALDGSAKMTRRATLHDAAEVAAWLAECN